MIVTLTQGSQWAPQSRVGRSVALSTAIASFTVGLEKYEIQKYNYVDCDDDDNDEYDDNDNGDCDDDDNDNCDYNDNGDNDEHDECTFQGFWRF